MQPGQIYIARILFRIEFVSLVCHYSRTFGRRICSTRKFHWKICMDKPFLEFQIKYAELTYRISCLTGASGTRNRNSQAKDYMSPLFVVTM